ncbi:hypothetical protein GBAR_LOCUS24725, partial [Geodia barretti]
SPHRPAPRLDVTQLDESVSFFLGEALAPATIQVRAIQISAFLSRGRSAASAVDRTSTLHVCHPPGCGIAGVSDTQLLSLSHPSSQHHGRTGRPLWTREIPGAAVCPQGSKAESQASKTTPAHNPGDPPPPQEPMGAPCQGDRLQDAMGSLLCGFFWVLEGRGVHNKASPQDVAVDDREHPTLIRIHIKSSKTDPFRHGVDIYLGRTGKDLYPVGALLAFMAVRPARQGPLFVYTDGTPLTRDRLVETVHRTLQQAGYSGHSFRIGAATAVAHAGLEDSVVKMLGRWESSAYQRYIKTP